TIAPECTTDEGGLRTQHLPAAPPDGAPSVVGGAKPPEQMTVVRDLTPGCTYEAQLYTVFKDKESSQFLSFNFTTTRSEKKRLPGSGLCAQIGFGHREIRSSYSNSRICLAVTGSRSFAGAAWTLQAMPGLGGAKGKGCLRNVTSSSGSRKEFRSIGRDEGWFFRIMGSASTSRLLLCPPRPLQTPHVARVWLEPQVLGASITSPYVVLLVVYIDIWLNRVELFPGPNAPGRFIVWFRNETTLLVLWQPPYPSGVFDKYKVSIYPADSPQSVLFVEKDNDPPGPAQAAFYGLVPGRAYNISVQTVSRDVVSQPTDAQYRT
ncbi:tyrosine-protein phosphatase 10D-like, partial [Tropilaelaps mercedesae]